MTVEETNKVDFPAWDKAKTRMILVIVDHMDWGENEGRHLLLLQKKLNAYLHYIEGGKLFSDYPWAAHVPIIISVHGQHSLSPEATKFYELAKGMVSDAGFSLEFKLLDQSPT